MSKYTLYFRKTVYGVMVFLLILRVIYAPFAIFKIHIPIWRISSSFHDITDPFLYTIGFADIFAKMKIVQKISFRTNTFIFGTLITTLGVLSEIGQKYHVFPGTYDRYDIVCFLVSYGVISLCVLIDFLIEKASKPKQGYL